MAVVKNTSRSEGDTQYYGIDTSVVNTEAAELFGSEQIQLFDTPSGFGIMSGDTVFPPGHKYAGTTGWLTTRSIVKCLDLISEGEIEGIVSGEFVPDDDDAYEGQIGWNGGEIKPFTTANPECFLRSIYLNDTPIVNVNNQYNFQQAEIAITNGTPAGVSVDDDFLFIGEDLGLEKTRVINERLRGPDVASDTDLLGEIPAASDEVFHYHSKVYRLLNRDIDKIKVNIKISALTYTKVIIEDEEDMGGGVMKVTQRWPMDDIGQVRGSQLTFKYRYRPIYKDKLGNLDLNTSRGWYGRQGSKPFVSHIKGKVTSPYLHPYIIEVQDKLKTEFLAGWEIEITRVTLDSIESHISNQTYIDSITEVYESVLGYPNAALAAMSFNAEYFSQIPTRAYDVRLLKVKVPGGPGGYDPILRNYNESPWEGDFADEKKWTDNPAWIFYDLLTNKRYGIGKHLGDVEVDKWTLYEIGRFCDTLVSDGEEGFEPRFTCNTLINTKEDAVKVLQDFASVFRSILYYGFGSVHAVCDKPRKEVAQFNNSSVAEGNFTYSSTAKKTIPTVCLVRYNDKDNFYKPAIEYVEHTEGIRKYGVVEKEITAFACTSRTQARRLGRWMLSTELEQTETITFTAGPEAMLLRPGDIVKVTDSNRSEKKYGGRATRAEARSIVLDQGINFKKDTEYELTLTTPTYFYDTSIVDIDSQSYISDFRRSQIQTFNFTTGINDVTASTVVLGEDSTITGSKISWTGDMFIDNSVTDIVDKATWSVTEVNDQTTNLYNVTSTKENDDLSYGIEAIVHSTGKYSYIESGVFYSYLKTPQGITAPPNPASSCSLALKDHPDSPHGFTKRIQITVEPCAGGGSACDTGTTVGYRIYVKPKTDWDPNKDMKKEGGTVPINEWLHETIYLSDQGESEDPISYYIPGRNEQRYFVRVFAINSISVLSSSFVDGQDGVVETPEDLNGIYVFNHYPVKDIKIHSLRLQTNYALQNLPEAIPTKERYLYTDDKDAVVQWEASFLNDDEFSLPIDYRVSIHDPTSSTSAMPSTELADYITAFTEFNFSFDRNMSMPNNNGPKRHYDLVVQAIDENGITSSGVNQGTNFGWDIVEVLNPKPVGYYLTPRRRNGVNVGLQLGTDKTWTEQYIDGDGYVHLNVLSNTIPDLAGGYAYISKHPFSGADFNSNGSPKTIGQRSHITFGSQEEFKKPEFEITETNFEAPAGTTYGTYNSEIVFKPTGMTGSYAPPYHMGVKFYDSFDREIKNNALNSTWDQGVLTRSSSIYATEGLYLAFGRDTTGTAGEIIKENYCFTTGSCGKYVGNPDFGGATDSSDTFSVRLLPTKYYSANQSAFKYWIRLNINGHWEGQGISHVKVLSQKDVETVYDYKGFFEYSCKSIDLLTGVVEDGITYNVYYPAHPESFTKCNFRQGKLSTSFQILANTIDDPYELRFWGGTTYYEGLPFYMVTGATRHFLGDSVAYLPTELSRAGIAPDYDMHVPGATNEGLDKIPSYNERGKVIANKSRPLRGFRRFRVYFDENNLPQPADEGGLASYGVIGMNAWNGEYESWQGSHSKAGEQQIDLSKDILFAKDGTDVFPSSVQSWLNKGDLFENIPGVWNHHPAGFGAGFGGLAKSQKFFDVHLGRMIDDSYLNEGFFGVTTTNDYSIGSQMARVPIGYTQDTELHEAVYSINPYVTDPDHDGELKWNEYL